MLADELRAESLLGKYVTGISGDRERVRSCGEVYKRRRIVGKVRESSVGVGDQRRGPRERKYGRRERVGEFEFART
jgi:hypothetical protein